MCHRCDRVRCKGVRRRNAAAHLHPAVARRYVGGSSSLSSSLLGTGEWRPSLGPTRRATTSTERRIDALTSTTRGIDALTSTMRGIGCRCCSPSNRATGYRELRHDGTQVCQFTAAVYSPTPSTRRRCFEIRHLHNLRILAAAAVTCHVAKTMVPSQPLFLHRLHQLRCSQELSSRVYRRRGWPSHQLRLGIGRAPAPLLFILLRMLLLLLCLYSVFVSRPFSNPQAKYGDRAPCDDRRVTNCHARIVSACRSYPSSCSCCC